MTLQTGTHYPLRLDSLPSGWRAGYVGDFAKEIEPGFASGEHNQTGNGVPHLRPMNVDRDGKINLSVVKFVAAEKDHRRLAQGDVLFNNTNSPELVGKTALLNQRGEFAFSNHMTRIRFGEDVLPNFGALQLHFLWMRGYYRYNCVKHVNQASISSKALSRGVPFIWAPIEEQRAIVAEIEKQFSRLDEAVANLKRVKANLKRYKAAILKAAVEGRLVPTEAQLARREGRSYETGAELLQRSSDAPYHQRKRNRKSKDTSSPDNTTLPKLREGWVWASLEIVAEAIGGYAFPSKSYDSSGYQVVKMANVKMGHIDLAQRPSYVSEVDEEIRARYALADGDILVTLTGTRRERDYGNIAVVRNQQGLLLNQRIARLRPAARIDSSFLALTLQSENYRNRFFAHETGNVGQGNVAMAAVTVEPVPVAPQAEQYRIVAEFDRLLSVIREVEGEVDANLNCADALRRATLLAAFSQRALDE